VLFALLEPLSALGLVVAFLLGLAVRAAGQDLAARALVGSTRPAPRMLSPRRDIDPFGAVAAVLGGTGWGRAAPVADPVLITRSALLRRAVVYLAGLVLPILAGEIVLGLYHAVSPHSQATQLYRPSDVLHGITGSATDQLLLSIGIGLISFGVFEIIPLPPCDGWGLLWLIWRRPGPQAQKARYWLAERNLGVAILLFLMLPLGISGGLAFPILDALGTPLVRLW
jgi:hypothetical protein